MRGFTCGTFDLFHAGHVAMLEECKGLCDYLIVGLQIDPSVDRFGKNKPVQSIVERQIQMRACKFIDEIIVYEKEKDLEDILGTIHIDIRFMGADWKHRNITGRQICKDKHIRLVYTSRKHRFSSSELRKRI